MNKAPHPDTIPVARAMENRCGKSQRSNPLVCIDEIKGAKRLSTFIVNAKQRASTLHVNGFQHTILPNRP